MEIRVLTRPITKEELEGIAREQFGDFVKAVVDIAKGVVAIGGELHADAEALLLERGSRQEDLWGVNLYPKKSGDERIEFNSMINIRSSQGNRSRYVEDAGTREAILNVIKKYIQ